MQNSYVDSKSYDFEKYALYAYIFAVSPTAFGPLFHYTGWVIALSALIYGKLRYGKDIINKPRETGKIIYTILIAYLIWSFAAHALTSDNFYYWGKSASVPLEMLIGATLAMRLLDSPRRRDIFSKCFLLTNTIIAIVLAVIELFQIPSPFHGLLNQNIVGLYGILIMPLFFCCAMCFYADRPILRLFIYSVVFILIFSSFSSGPWIVGLVQLVIIILYALKKHITSCKSIFNLIVVLTVCVFCLNFVTGNKLFPRVRHEICQLLSVEDMDSLTSRRDEIWKAGLYMIKEQPVLGYGRALYNKRYDEHLAVFIDKKIVNPSSYSNSHPHSMYLGSVFDAGIPGLLFILAAFIFSIKKSCSILKRKASKPEVVCWALICLSLFAGQLVYGLIGDVFESRNDMAVIFWAMWGILIALPEEENDSGSAEIDKTKYR